jgi:meiotically up-regulated gene 157 (Mug157) protein
MRLEDPERRGFLGGAASAALPIGRPAALDASGRPQPSARRWVSPAVEAELLRVSAMIRHPGVRRLFINAFPNTLDTAVTVKGPKDAPDAFVSSGEIPCLGLRDSACQVRPYLPLARGDPALTTLFRGLIRRHARSILIDPYASAFMADEGARTRLSWARDDKTEMRRGVAERKWEVDSLLHPLRLAHDYWRASDDVRPFDAVFVKAFGAILATLKAQQRLGDPGPYRFRRLGLSPQDTLAGNGFGPPSRKVGLIHSMFRPSGDACVLPFLIPSNLFAVKALRQGADLMEGALGERLLAKDARGLAADVEAALRIHGVMPGPGGAPVYAFEADGFGNALFLDDANVPSLLSLSYLGADGGDAALARRTAALAWTPRNPAFVQGRVAEGVTGGHVGEGWIWPLSIIMRGMTAEDGVVAVAALRTLAATDAGTGFIHEAFDADDPTRFSRPWFPYGNGLFAEFILGLARHRPAVLAEA